MFFIQIIKHACKFFYLEEDPDNYRVVRDHQQSYNTESSKIKIIF